jgi:Lecithin retinol acyltransferase
MGFKQSRIWIHANRVLASERQRSSGEQEFALGAHLATARFGYTHHGIYIGGGKVVHYAGLSHSWHSGPVEEVTLARFTLGHPVRIIDHPEAVHSPQEIVRRALSRVGEQGYSLLTNNCEHFCNWSVSGLSRSMQIERPSGLPALTVCLAARFITRLAPVRARQRGLVTSAV